VPTLAEAIVNDVAVCLLPMFVSCLFVPNCSTL
jgi:hypothetical protein